MINFFTEASADSTVEGFVTFFSIVLTAHNIKLKHIDPMALIEKKEATE